jgi:hypothetical protein
MWVNNLDESTASNNIPTYNLDNVFQVFQGLRNENADFEGRGNELYKGPTDRFTPSPDPRISIVESAKLPSIKDLGIPLT